MFITAVCVLFDQTRNKFLRLTLFDWRFQKHFFKLFGSATLMNKAPLINEVREKGFFLFSLENYGPTGTLESS